MDIVPSLWVSTYYCILGWHLVITKNQKKKNYLLVCYFKTSIAIRLLYCERCFEKFHTEYFFFLREDCDETDVTSPVTGHNGNTDRQDCQHYNPSNTMLKLPAEEESGRNWTERKLLDSTVQLQPSSLAWRTCTPLNVPRYIPKGRRFPSWGT